MSRLGRVGSDAAEMLDAADRLEVVDAPDAPASPGGSADPVEGHALSRVAESFAGVCSAIGAWWALAAALGVVVLAEEESRLRLLQGADLALAAVRHALR